MKAKQSARQSRPQRDGLSRLRWRISRGVVSEVVDGRWMAWWEGKIRRSGKAGLKLGFCQRQTNMGRPRAAEPVRTDETWEVNGQPSSTRIVKGQPAPWGLCSIMLRQSSECNLHCDYVCHETRHAVVENSHSTPAQEDTITACQALMTPGPLDCWVIKAIPGPPDWVTTAFLVPLDWMIGGHPSPSGLCDGRISQSLWTVC